MRKLLAFATLISSTLFIVSCGNDDGNPNPSGNVSITGIPAAAQVASGDDLTVTGVTLTADAGIASFTVSVDGGTATDLGATAGETSQTVDLTLSTDGLAIGLRTLVFTLTDANGTEATVQHGLTIDEFGLVNVTENVTADATWTANNIYVLGTRVSVESGATLTIEAGAVIKGEAGSGANATALLIARGATLNAVGTANAPIIFTTIADEIEPGEIASPNLDPELNGLWGGLLILGNARISADNESEQIEGIPASDSNGLYGGTDDADNSGTIQYVSVRHGGANIGEGNEINGITLGGVGSGTTIGWVEVVGNQDDGIEWFGGVVDVDNALVWGAGDDAIDTDQAWAGTLDNFIVINPGDECFELDGPEGSYTGAGHTITNGSVSVQDASGLIDFDANTDVNMSNVFFFDIADGAGQDVEEYAAFSAQAGFDASGVEAIIPSGVITDYFVDMTGAASAVTSGNNTVEADKTEFSGWTFADANGELADF